MVPSEPTYGLCFRPTSAAVVSERSIDLALMLPTVAACAPALATGAICDH